MVTPGNQSASRQLSPVGLAADFGYAGGVAADCVNALYQALKDRQNVAGGEGFKRWKRALLETGGISYSQSEPWALELSQKWRLKEYRVSAPKLLFAFQTYYALVVVMLLRKLAPGLPECLAYADYSWPEKWARESKLVADCLAALEGAVAGYQLPGKNPDDLPALDLLQPLYEDLFPRAVRHKLGEFYTPRWLVEHLLDELGYRGNPSQRLLDPSCGSGAFLLAAISRIREYYRKGLNQEAISERVLAKLVLENVTGCDVNPLAVLAARTNYVAALGGLSKFIGKREIPIHLKDTILADEEPRDVDFIAGNPPWINWEHLSTDYRVRISGLWQRYGLFEHKGLRARLGAGKDDLSILMTYAVHDKYLKSRGKLGFVITQSVFKSKGGGRGFRSFSYTSKDKDTHLQPIRVDDFSAMRVFKGAINRTAMFICKKGSTAQAYPVNYRVWKGRGAVEQDCSWRQVRKRLDFEDQLAEPVDLTDKASPWLTAPTQIAASLRKLIGPSDYRAREGVNTGGMDGCYTVREVGPPRQGVVNVSNVYDAGRNKLEPVTALVESELVFPLLRGRDVSRWRIDPSAKILLPNRRDRFGGISEQVMREKYKRTLAYLKRFEGSRDGSRRGTLRGRPLYQRFFEPGDPFYSLYNVGPYTFTRWKVFWRYIADGMVAAANIAAKPLVIPNTKLMIVACESRAEACFVAALLNSTPCDLLVRSFTISTQLAPHILETVRIPRFDASLQRHAKLADLSLKAHRAVAKGRLGPIVSIEDEIDKLAARIWGLTSGELRRMQGELSSKKRN